MNGKATIILNAYIRALIKSGVWNGSVTFSRCPCADSKADLGTPDFAQLDGCQSSALHRHLDRRRTYSRHNALIARKSYDQNLSL